MEFINIRFCFVLFGFVCFCLFLFFKFCFCCFGVLAYCFVIIFVGLCSSGGSVCRVQLMTWVTVIRLFLLRMMTCSFQNKTENLVQIATRVNLIGVISFFYAMSILRHWCTFCTNWFQCCIFYLDQLIYSLVFFSIKWVMYDRYHSTSTNRPNVSSARWCSLISWCPQTRPL